ncbi:MAG: DUF5018 domain-containing protein [Bacteroidales bacterium]|nr:DUF5018 domain-containing protein [Bacteroidales bacterium]
MIEYIMKKIFYLLSAVVLALVSSCQEPEYIEPTTERQGITSLTAYFTLGKFVDQELAKLVIDDPDADRYVIPVPWFYPEESEDGTVIHMTRARVRAELAPNCKIEPALTILDLTLENKFTYTNAQGESREIIITGVRKKSSKADAMSFTLSEPYPVEGFVNDEKSEIYLFTTDNLDGFTADVKVSAHASVKTDLSVARNYNEPQKVTIVAHDGTERTYDILKKYPTRIPYGFREKSVRQLFNFEPVTRLGFPQYTTSVYPSLAYIGGQLVVCFGDGSAPVCLNALTGVKEGNVTLGSASAGSVTNDEGGNLIITSHTEAAATCSIYRTKATDQAPVLFHSFVNDTDVPVGYHVKVHGNIDGDAVIILSHEGVAGVTETSKYTKVVVSGGAVVSTETINVAGLGLSWGAAPTNTPKVSAASANPADGEFVVYYSRNILSYINGNGAIAAEFDLANFGASGNFNTNCLDAKTYNNTTYLASLITSHFPMWGAGPRLNVFDVTSPTSIKEGKPVLSNNELEWFQKADAGCAAGDVVMAPSADGFKVYIYYYDHNCGVLGGYVADCIDMTAI